MNKLSVTVDGYTFEVEVDLFINGETHLTVKIDGEEVEVIAPNLQAPASELDWFIVEDRPYEVAVDQGYEWMRSPWGIHSLEIEDLETPQARPRTGDGRIKAPIPGQISQVMVARGEMVEMGQPLMVLEAMKMENEIRAPQAGVVKELHVVPGKRVVLNEVLIEIE